MVVRIFSIALVVCLAWTRPALADATLFRVFLRDGSSFVSYGEMARVSDQVIVSMPVGGTPDDPLLHAVTLPASMVDWARTDRHAESARYLKYVETRAEADYERLVGDVAAALNRIAQTTDPAQALALAERTRRAMADWPRTHYGYRQHEVRDVVTLLDQAISTLRGTGTIELSFVATVGPAALEPMATMPSHREQLDQLQRVLNLTTSGRDRVALLQAALLLVASADATIVPRDRERVRRALDRQLRDELETDERYARLTQRTVGAASRAAADARITEVERALDSIDREDAKLGRRRPDVVQALRHSVNVQLDAARKLRLLRDQWVVRQDLYRRYQRVVGSQLMQLVKAQPSLEAIRRLDGPPPDRLTTLWSRLSGGAERLDRVLIPDQLRSTHELLVGSWRFAETATRARLDAVSSGSLPTAWEASSAAAGALLMLSRAQQELRAFLEPPTLQ